MLRLALPVFAEQSLNMLVGLSDQLLTGRFFEQEHLAAINLMIYLLWLTSSLFVVIAIGATAMTARFVGAKDYPAARRVTNQAILLGVVMAAGLTLLGLALREQFVAVMQLDGRSAELASQYLWYVIPVLPAIMFDAVGISCLRGAGDMVTGLVIMVIVNLVNVSVSWSLAIGLGPLPQLGWQGLAIGTAAGYLVGGLLVLTLLIVGRSGLWIRPHLLRPDGDLIRRLLRIGVPGGLDVLSVIACQLWFVAIINQLGDLAAAAHGVAIRIESLAYLPGTAFQVAAATMAGQFLGARDYDRASRSVLMACLVGGGFMVFAGGVFFFGADELTQLFLSSDRIETAALAAPLLRIVALSMPGLALTMILSGALRGAGDTRWPLVFTLIGNLGVRIPGTYLLAHHLDYGVRGAWYAMVADIFVRAVLVGYRFWQGDWKRTGV